MDVAYLSRNMSASPQEIWSLPHSHYLAYLKHNVTLDLQETEDGRKLLENFKKYMNPRVDADLSTIRGLAGYAKKEVGD